MQTSHNYSGEFREHRQTTEGGLPTLYGSHTAGFVPLHNYPMLPHSPNSGPVYIDGLEQERCNSIANALELHLFCTNPSIYGTGTWAVTLLGHGSEHDFIN